MNKKLVAMELIKVARLLMAEDIDPKYQNPDNTFKKMAPVDDPSGKKNKFNGCVKYMMDKEKYTQEIAEKTCGEIAKHKHGG